MKWLLNKLRGWLAGKPASLTCSEAVWLAGAQELARRTRGRTRESGAFLLGREGKAKRIEKFVFYDDLDPQALSTGIVHFDGSKFPLLWSICRDEGLYVVADVHVHPGDYGQSYSDRTEPAIPRAGHIAMILPDFAQREVRPGGIGIYEYLGNHQWTNRTKEGRAFFRLE
jgi:proteasome lid subunit RPN8/RPN11